MFKAQNEKEEFKRRFERKKKDWRSKIKEKQKLLLKKSQKRELEVEPDFEGREQQTDRRVPSLRRKSKQRYIL